MIKLRTYTVLTYSVIFGLIAIGLTRVLFPTPFGVPNLGSTAVVLAAVLCPWPVGPIVAIIKGIAVSAWTGVWYIEFPGGLGDAIMAVFAHRLCKQMKAEYAVIGGQLSRFIFTSGSVALFVATQLTLGMPTVQLAALQNLGRNAGFLSYFAVAFTAITYPTVLLSVTANLVVSVVALLILQKRFPTVLKRLSS